MKPRVYVETTIPSYLTAWPSRDVVRAAHQHLTREWWDRKDDFELFISELVVRECEGGDASAAAARLAALADLPLVTIDDEVEELAQTLIARIPLPERASSDALHIAAAAVHGMDYLLTWNCTHIANATWRSQIEDICREHGYEPPVICTPAELPAGDDTNEAG